MVLTIKILENAIQMNDIHNKNMNCACGATMPTMIETLSFFVDSSRSSERHNKNQFVHLPDIKTLKHTVINILNDCDIWKLDIYFTVCRDYSATQVENEPQGSVWSHKIVRFSKNGWKRKTYDYNNLPLIPKNSL